MMQFHTIHTEEWGEKVGQARGLLKFIAGARIKPDHYSASIQQQFERTVKYPDEAFFHDDLSEINQPFYFFEFMGRLNAMASNSSEKQVRMIWIQVNMSRKFLKECKNCRAHRRKCGNNIKISFAVPPFAKPCSVMKKLPWLQIY